MDPTTLPEPSLYTIKAVFILDSDGRRLLAKYYDDSFPSTKEQTAFEKKVFNKTHKTDSDIAFLEGMTIVYKSSIDLFLYVVGSAQENELMLMAVLGCLFDSLSHMLRKSVEKRSLLENMDGAFLVLDEIVDGGVILESDSQQVVQKLNFRNALDAPYGFVLFDYITGSTEQNTPQPSLEGIKGSVSESSRQLFSVRILTEEFEVDDNPLSEQNVAQVLQSAKEQIKWSLLK